jgi:predicted nucleic acid-binding protein
MTVLTDSDILIELFRGRNRAVVTRWRELEDTGAVIWYSPVSAAEVWAGARPQEREAIITLFGSIRCAPIDYETGTRAGDYMLRYRKSHSLALGDALIAASASLCGAALWTRNRKHFPMPGLSFF